MATQMHMHDTTANTIRAMWMIIGLVVAAILVYAAYSYYQSDRMVVSATSADNIGTDANRTGAMTPTENTNR